MTRSGSGELTTALPRVRWGVGPFAFELTSDDPAVVRHATGVLGCWQPEDVAGACERWHVQREPAAAGRPSPSTRAAAHVSVARTLPSRVSATGPDGVESVAGWRVHGPAGLAVTARSVQRAVMAVEAGAVSWLVRSRAVTAHGALVAWEGEGVLIVGRGEAGKSTLACVLWQRGARLLGDDVTVLEPESGRARPGPRRVSIRHSSRALVGDALLARIARAPSSAPTADGWLFHPGEVAADPPAEPPAGPVRLRALVFLARRGHAPAGPRPEPIPAAHALLALLPYTNRRTRDPGDALRILGPLARRVPAFDLGRGPVAAMAAAVEGLVGVAVSS